MKNILFITLCFLFLGCNPYKNIQAISDGKARNYDVTIDSRFTVHRGPERLYIEHINLTALNRRIPGELAALEVRYKIRQFFANRIKVERGLAMDQAALQVIHQLFTSKFPDLDIEVNDVWVRHQRTGVLLHLDGIMHQITKIKATPYVDIRTGQNLVKHERVLN